MSVLYLAAAHLHRSSTARKALSSPIPAAPTSPAQPGVCSQPGISDTAVLPAAQGAAGRVSGPDQCAALPFLWVRHTLHCVQDEPGNGIRAAALPHPCSVPPGHVSEPLLENGAPQTHHCQLFHQAAGPQLSEDPNELKQSSVCPQRVCQAWLGEEGSVWNSFLPLSPSHLPLNCQQKHCLQPEAELHQAAWGKAGQHPGKPQVTGLVLGAPDSKAPLDSVLSLAQRSSILSIPLCAPSFLSLLQPWQCQCCLGDMFCSDTNIS